MEQLNENGENLYKPRKSFGQIFMQMLFSHFGLFIVVAIYAAAGASAFVKIEGPFEDRLYEIKRHRAIEVNNSMQYMTNLFWWYQEKNWTYADFNVSVYQELKSMEAFIIHCVQNFNYDGAEEGWDYSWTYPNSLLLTMTIMSTIGYGHIAPATSWGKFFCMIYAMIGCPLLLVFLGNLGSAMANSFIYIYSRCLCRICRSRRNLEELPPNASKKQVKLLIDDEIGKEEYMPTQKLQVPITLNLVLLFGYIMLGAVLFSFWETWDLGSSSYFTFVTLSTIGFGDMVPGAAVLKNANLEAGFQMFFCILYIVLGMALLSMCINLMQEQLIEKWQWMSKEIGLNKKKTEVKENKKNPKAPNGKDKDKNDKPTSANPKPPSANPKPPSAKPTDPRPITPKPEDIPPAPSPLPGSLDDL